MTTIYEGASELENEDTTGETISAEVPLEVRKKIEEILTRRFTDRDGSDPKYLEIVLEEDLPEVLEKEIEFARRVLDAYERWSPEEDPIVLWDIDDTMGKYTMGPARKWHFRAAFGYVIEQIQERFPNVRNGIISDRKSLGELSLPEGFLDEGLVFLTGNEEVPANQQPQVEEELFEMLDIWPDDAGVRKHLLIQKLLRQGLNVHTIDDNRTTSALGDRGLCTELLMPRI